jgi:hypothetical protein
MNFPVVNGGTAETEIKGEVPAAFLKKRGKTAVN